ncbi:hybrid sensor histidine kinase/response regulator [Massilia phosphatilytica]|nr:hybrid sensor histidine kinase/response regulator [Massilia phosphatilytica]
MELQTRRHPWETTPVGPVAQWPFSLKLAVRTLLDCQLPMYLVWGDDFIEFFNDAYVPVLGDRKDKNVGGDARRTWAEIWSTIGPLFERVRQGEPVGFQDLGLPINRYGYVETCYFTFSYSPVYDEEQRVGGVLATFIETTGKVLAERRRAFQLDLADILRRATAADASLQAALRHVSTYVDGAAVTYAEISRAGQAAVIREQWQGGARTAVSGTTTQLAQLALGRPACLEAGETVCVDPGADGTMAGIAVPLMEGRRLVAVLMVQAPHVAPWAVDEVRLLEDTARRTWEALRRIRAEEALREETRMLELMKGATETLASTITLEPLMQAITDAATQLVGAEFGAFFYNGRDDNGDVYQLYSLTGAPREAFAAIGMPRATPVFGPTFHGSEPIRSDDIRQDPRYGKMAPHHGMPAGHFPVVSYLAASVISRSGEVIGGLFFAHSQRAMFSERSEELIGAFAVQAAIAIDNARLYDMAQRAAEEREHLLASERAARAEAERHNKMKDEFLAMLAHELRNPLAPITSAAQLLRLPEVNEGLRLKASNIISRQVRHMTELVDDLLDVSRVTRGLVKLENEILDLNKVAMAAVEQARPHIEERQHTLTVELPDAPVPVEGDRTRLIQVLVNLLNNSAKYTPPGGRVALVVTVADGAAQVAVRDNGSGIDAQLLPHVFDLFTQADRAPDRSQGGLGIGLALVKSIVRMHNGQVAAHSAGPQQGTTMTVALPLAQAEVGQVVRSGEGSGPARPLTVTIVDDNDDAGHSLAVLLRAHGHTVHVHEDAAGTLGHADPATEVFILDIGLPDMTGYELARRLRRDARHAPAVYVALTGYGQQRDRELSQQAGFDHHLVKPVEIGKLAQILAAKAEGKPVMEG